MSVGDLLSSIRRRGWTVAVHNDYKLNGVTMTFWLFTKAADGSLLAGVADGFFVKGEGETDFLALVEIAQKLKLL